MKTHASKVALFPFLDIFPLVFFEGKLHVILISVNKLTNMTEILLIYVVWIIKKVCNIIVF